MLTDLLDWLQNLPPVWVVVGAGVLVFGECTLGLGFIAPGETGLFVLGTTATSLPAFLVMWLVTTVCAVAGDSVGYVIGKRYGPRLRQTKIVRRHGAQGWDRATEFLRRRGAIAVLVAIFLPGPEQPPTMSLAGPTYAPRELAARKVVALFDRYAARDFVDVTVTDDLISRDLLNRCSGVERRANPGRKIALESCRLIA